MSKFNFNDYKGKTLPIEIPASPGKESINITAGAEILGSCRELAWGEITAKGKKEFNVFILDFDERGKAKGCHFHPRAGFPDKFGNFRPVSNKEEAERFFSIQQGFLIDQIELAEVKSERQKKLAETQQMKEKKGQEIKAKRDELKSEFQKLSSGLSIEEQLSSKDLQSLASKLSLFNLLYPERIKI